MCVILVVPDGMNKSRIPRWSWQGMTDGIHSAHSSFRPPGQRCTRIAHQVRRCPQDKLAFIITLKRLLDSGQTDTIF